MSEYINYIGGIDQYLFSLIRLIIITLFNTIYSSNNPLSVNPIDFITKYNYVCIALCILFYTSFCDILTLFWVKCINNIYKSVQGRHPI